MSASFSNPRGVHAYLNEYVIGQERAKKILSVAMFNHHLRIQALARKAARCKSKSGADQTSDVVEEDHVLEKANVLLVGPSGCGKTLLSQHLAESCNLPFTIFDCSGLVKTGYVGTHSDRIMEDLLAAAGDDVEKAQHGVVVLDEIDKLRKSKYGDDVGGLGAQQALLKLIEGKQVSVRRNNYSEPPKFIDSTNVLFIAAGAFCDILDTIYLRMLEGDSSVTCADRKNESLLLQHLLPRDLIKYGMIPELVGRIPVVVKLDPWNIELMKEVITGTKRSILKQYQWLFKAHKVGMTMTPEAIHEVALQAIAQKTGARGIRTIMEDVLGEAMYEVPGSDVQTFVVTAANVRKEEEIHYEREASKEEEAVTAQSAPRTDGSVTEDPGYCVTAAKLDSVGGSQRIKRYSPY